jgi:hypothetical protein
MDAAVRAWRAGEIGCAALLFHAKSDRALCAGMYVLAHVLTNNYPAEDYLVATL